MQNPNQSAPRPPFPKQKLEKPGIESEMKLAPKYEAPAYKVSGKLERKVALVTGGDSGIGRAVAVLYAREGASVAITHLPEEEKDALETQKVIENTGNPCLRIVADLSASEDCRRVVREVISHFGKLDILVSNAAHQNSKETLEEVSEAEWELTFKTNIDAYFHLVKAALPHLKAGSSIIATGSVTGFFGKGSLPDYSSTKGAIHTFTKTLAQSLLSRGIRVNAVAPGPVWTPLNPADEGRSPDEVAQFGESVPMKRPAQPEEIAPAYVFLASNADSSYITGVILPELGGETLAA
jgi:NAD(P)-dependent dehydrogenase (short-subunit alcohol dehydrogenase family)